MARTKQTVKRGQVKGSSDAVLNPALLGTLALLVVLGFASYASQVALYPLFGKVLTSENYLALSANVVLLFTVIPSSYESPTVPLALLSSSLFLAPLGVQLLSSWAARSAGALWGPVLGQAPVAVPVLACGVIALKTVMRSIPLIGSLPPLLRGPIVGSVAIIGVVVVDAIASRSFPMHGDIRPKTLFYALGIITTAMNFSASFPRRSLFALLPLPLIGLSLIQLKTPSEGIFVLTQVQSVTGLLTVTDSLISKHPFRMLRCDASLIGGRWLMGMGEEERGTPATPVLGDSVYASFVLHQAGLLVEGLEDKRALILGLGAGISTKAYIQSGFNTTVIELDPAVYDLARTYFDLPRPAAFHAEDARAWVAKRVTVAEASANQEEYRYDVIVHDVFTGGSIPAKLFTIEFWQNLKKILNEDGVVIVNYIGHQRSPALVGILRTLMRVFGTCEAFHDGILEYPPFVPQSKEYIADLVIICTHSSPSLEFRVPVEEDFHGSALAQNVFETLAERKVNLKYTLGRFSSAEGEGWVVEDGQGETDLQGWVKRMAVEYWLGMRQFVPAEAWEAYD